MSGWYILISFLNAPTCTFQIIDSWWFFVVVGFLFCLISQFIFLESSWFIALSFLHVWSHKFLWCLINLAVTVHYSHRHKSHELWNLCPVTISIWQCINTNIIVSPNINASLPLLTSNRFVTLHKAYALNLFLFLQNLETFSPGIRDQMTATFDPIKCCETFFSCVISFQFTFFKTHFTLLLVLQ